MVKPECTETGFIHRIENARVRYVACDYEKRRCTVFFHDRPPRELAMAVSPFNAQYGLPVSDDGTRLFFSDWDHGLWAYDLDSGETAWYAPQSRVTYLLPDGPRLVAVRQDRALLSFDVGTGAVLGEVRSGSVSDLFRLEAHTVLVNALSGRLCAVRTQDLSVYKRYSPKAVNPNRCLSLLIQNAALRDNALTITGVERHPARTYSPDPAQPFTRIIDPAFRDLS